VLLRGTADGTLVEITDCNGTPAQTCVYLGGTLVNTNSNKCLTAGALGTQLTIQTAMEPLASSGQSVPEPSPWAQGK
jgi:hypothetical protein